MVQAGWDFWLISVTLYLAFITYFFWLKKRDFEQEIINVNDHLEDSKNYIENLLQNAHENLSNQGGFDIMEMIQMQRAQIVTNLLEFGAQKLASRFGNIDVGIHQIMGPDGGENIERENDDATVER